MKVNVFAVCFFLLFFFFCTMQNHQLDMNTLYYVNDDFDMKCVFPGEREKKIRKNKYKNNDK